ncbi:fatty acyl-CoA reductase 2-like [Vitis riparia]|uniref:fatty acyl-CoA reductase 2-like n=1 Tax=Vitis riparia TaxID=96939 RepID=UPI00155A5C1C|nr:fatty acyl-CoA reductase 2-like [Vitis riparia]
MTSFFKTSVIELKAVQKSSHVHRNDHGYGTNISTSLWKRKHTGIFCCQSGESDRALMQQSKTQKVRALKEMAVSTTTTPNTSITNGLGILQFLAGKTYFITGATGLLAKAVVEKILRTAPDVGKIFVLIKAKNKEAAVDRLKTEFINSELFECLKQRHGKYYQDFMLSKLAPVVGNLCESDLGIDANLISEIAQEVDVIINSAANTKFEERLHFINHLNI